MWKEEYKHLGLRLSLPLLLSAKIPYVLAAFSSERGCSLPLRRDTGRTTAQMVRRARRVMTHSTFYMVCGHELYVDATPHKMVPMTVNRLLDYKHGLDGRLDASTECSDLPARYLYVVRTVFTGPRFIPAGPG
eukprot:GHVU01150310.1.p3 GENE.GHVU01150310.1~~GHVU01150310.1.p3  ORF type:complete len:133 (-),score=10.56 GHVU01150310.1:131-529(-)